MAPNWPLPEASVGSRRTATRVTRGSASLSNSSHFVPILYSSSMNPVVLPPGRAKLATKPAPTGSTTDVNTTGNFVIDCCSAPTDGLPDAKMASGMSATSSSAYSRIRLATPAPHRMSILMFPPSVHPNRLSSARNAARRARPSGSSAAKSMSTPMRRTGLDCARAASGHATAALPSSVMNSRLFTRSPRRRPTAVSAARSDRACGQAGG
jgi:hypothetical protein